MTLPKAPKSGSDLIAAERYRQVAEEGWSAEHDDREQDDGALAMAACCYAAPELIYVKNDRGVQAGTFYDPWPWGEGGDKRFAYGENRKNASNKLPCPSTYSDAERIDLLVKAGALIAAEIDRLQRRKPSKKGKR